MRTTPQQDLLIVHALVGLAREHRKTAIEAAAIDLANEIAADHDLTVADALRQLAVDELERDT